MPRLIPVAGTTFDAGKIDTGFSPNHECNLSTEEILTSLDELSRRSEMAEFTSLVKQSPQYFSREAVDK
jgi:hypothetical protein